MRDARAASSGTSVIEVQPPSDEAGREDWVRGLTSEIAGNVESAARVGVGAAVNCGVPLERDVVGITLAEGTRDAT